MSEYRIISSDNHVVEPPDLWTTRMGHKHGDRCPQLLNTGDGEFWYVDNMKTFNLANMASQPGRRFEEPQSLVRTEFWENARPGAYIGEEALKDMDIDGVDAGVFYPTLTIFLFPVIEDAVLLMDINRAYNDWVAEFCQASPKRLKPSATLIVDDVPAAVAEMERCAKMGFVGATIPAYDGRLGYDSPEYDPVWAAAQDLGMPISLHIASPRPKPGKGWDRELGPMVFANHLLTNGDHWVRVSFYEMICTGVFDRFPRLKVGSVEHELNWVPYFLDRMDYDYSDRAAGVHGYRLKNAASPSDVFHSNCFVDFQEDAAGIRNRDVIGVDNILWGSDYPHTESTWPRSLQFIEDTLADCTEDERRKIVSGNAERIFGI